MGTEIIAIAAAIPPVVGFLATRVVAMKNTEAVGPVAFASVFATFFCAIVLSEL